MTDLLTRPTPCADPAGPAQPDRRSALLPAVAAAGWAALPTLAVCVLGAVAGWLAGSGGTAGDAVRAGADAWLLAHSAGLQLPDTTVHVVPLGLTLAAGALLYRAGRWAGAAAAGTSLRSTGGATAVLSAGYAVFAGALAVLAGTPDVRPDAVRAIAGAAVLAAACGGAGLVREGGLGGELSAIVPAPVRAAARGAAAGILALTGAGSLVFVGGLLADFSAAEAVWTSLRAGAVGGAVLALAGLLLLPNAALWAVAFAAGSGFTVGADTTVAPAGVELGPVPAIPLLAALPGEGPQPWWATALVLLPVLAGGLAATVALRRHPGGSSMSDAALAGCTGAGAGLVLGALAGLAGAAGPGRLSELGPGLLATAAAAAAEMALGGLAVWAGWRLLHRRSGGKESAAG